MVKEAPKPIPHQEASHREAIRAKLVGYGLETLSPQQEADVFTSFTTHLLRKLNHESGESSLLAAPSHLRPVNREEFVSRVPLGEFVLDFEVGGTNIRAAKVVRENTSDGDVVVIQDSVKQGMSKKTYDSSLEFFEEVAQVAQSVVGQDQPKHIGIVWSYPPEKTEDTPSGVDIYSTDDLTKELTIKGIADAPLSKQLLTAMGIDPDRTSVAVLNDTVAVLLAGFGKVGGVIGTGFNLATTYNGEIYNLEAGGFSEVPQTDLTSAIDRLSGKEGRALAEKQISGLYVGQTFDYVVGQLHKNGEIPYGKTRKLRAKDMTALLSGDQDAIAQIYPHLDDESREVMTEAGRVLVERSAQLAGTMIAALVNQLEDSTITVPIEGSFFNLTPGYRDLVQKTIDRNAKNKAVTLIGVEQSGLKGAAIAALTVNETNIRRNVSTNS